MIPGNKPLGLELGQHWLNHAAGFLYCPEEIITFHLATLDQRADDLSPELPV